MLQINRRVEFEGMIVAAASCVLMFFRFLMLVVLFRDPLLISFIGS